jgi:hypothetical protein
MPQPFPVAIEQPDDLFTTEVAPVLDEARGIIEELGLRPYRVFLVIDRYTGPERKQGALEERKLTEIKPAPVVRFASTAKIAMSGGLLQEGSATLEEISRTFTKEQLRGKTIAGDDLPKELDFWIAVIARGERHAERYQPASDPVLEPTSWSMSIRPGGRREPLTPVGPD